MSFHRSEIDAVVDNFKSDQINGLEYLEIPSLRIIYGPNKLEEEEKVNIMFNVNMNVFPFNLMLNIVLNRIISYSDTLISSKIL